MNLRPSPENVIIADPEKCSGCHRCELACSLKHFGFCSPFYSRIRIYRLEESHLPLFCEVCADAPCLKVCPVNARTVLANSTVDTEEERCIGCRACLYICPFGAPVISPATKKAMSCNLCLNDKEGPWCVRACGREGALIYLPLKKTARTKAGHAAQYWQTCLAARKRSIYARLDGF